MTWKLADAHDGKLPYFILGATALIGALSAINHPLINSGAMNTIFIYLSGISSTVIVEWLKNKE